MRLPNMWWIAGAAAVLGIAVAQAQPAAAPLIQNTFEENQGDWQVVTVAGQSAKISITHDAANVKVGKGALQFDYAVAKGEVNVAMLPVAPGALTKMKSMRFWVKVDHTTPIVVMLQEKNQDVDEGRYVAVFTVPKDKWQFVELAPSDFILSDGPGDPKDPDNKLDLDKVATIAITDFSQLFAQADNADFVKLLNVQMGPHTFYLDDFSVGEDLLADSSPSANGDIQLDNFVRPQISWVAIGDVRFSLSTGKPLDGRGLQADYHQTPDRPIGFIRGVPHAGLAGTDQMRITIASSKPAKLVIQVEETSGGKYNTMIDVPGGSEVKEFKLAFADFKAADDSKDDDGKLDMDQVKQFLIFDASGLIDKADQDNTLYINNLHFTRPTK